MVLRAVAGGEGGLEAQTSGKVVVRARTGVWGELNADLHAKQ